MIASIATICRCGHAFDAGPEHAGRRVRCPACKAPVAVPAAAAAPGPAGSSPFERHLSAQLDHLGGIALLALHRLTLALILLAILAAPAAYQLLAILARLVHRGLGGD